MPSDDDTTITAQEALLLDIRQTQQSQSRPQPQQHTGLTGGIMALLAALKLIKSPVPNRANGITAQKVVRTSGTPEQLPNFTIPNGFALVIKAKKRNTNNITLGFTSGAALNTGSEFFSLAPNEKVSYAIQNANLVWIDAKVSGEGCELTAEV